MAIVALAAGCGGTKHASLGTTGSRPVVGSGTYTNGAPVRGGVYRVGWEEPFGFTDNFDPTGEYLVGSAWGLYTNLMLRPLIGYKHLPGVAGNTLVGDLATSVPTPTDGGLTYVYTLRKGVRFGPPINRTVTSRGRRVCPPAPREPERRRSIPLLLQGHQGLGHLRRGEGKDDLGDRHFESLETPDPSAEGDR